MCMCVCLSIGRIVCVETTTYMEVYAREEMSSLVASAGHTQTRIHTQEHPFHSRFEIIITVIKH